MEAENFTVFEKISIPFCRGLNVLVGENGVGKTHVMKIAYAACQASKHDVSFSQKSVMLFRPDQSSIGRLVNRRKNGNNTAKISVESDVAKIGMSFSIKTKKWDAEIKTEPNWEKQMSDNQIFDSFSSLSFLHYHQRQAHQPLPHRWHLPKSITS